MCSLRRILLLHHTSFNLVLSTCFTYPRPLNQHGSCRVSMFGVVLADPQHRWPHTECLERITALFTAPSRAD